MLSPGRCFACSGGLSAKPLEGFEIHPGPPAPAAYRCTPCSQGMCVALCALHGYTRTHTHVSTLTVTCTRLRRFDGSCQQILIMHLCLPPFLCRCLCPCSMNVSDCVGVCKQRRQITSTPTPSVGQDRGAVAAAWICQLGQSSFGPDWHVACVIKKTLLQLRICPPSPLHPPTPPPRTAPPLVDW
jgi:hypothetical protein